MSWEKVFWRFAYLAIVFVGVISAIIIAKTPTQEQGEIANALNVKMAPLINLANRPVVISEATQSVVLRSDIMSVGIVCVKIGEISTAI
ncbi:MAG: hypothetical protein AAGJ08_17875 [Cyanobacteria bacterium P01_H01_bin.35]